MRICLVLALVFVSFFCFYTNSSDAFELKYPGERGFYIGVPITYIIANESNPENIGKEGIFTFGNGRITINAIEYYDCTYETPVGMSNFYLQLDPVNEVLIQKELKAGLTELSIDPAIRSVDYPISPGSNWSETVDLTAKNIEIPGMGKLNIPLTIKGVKVDTEVSSSTITVPAGTFDALLVESTYSGSLLGIPMTLVQRTWLNIENITIKRSFEFTKPSSIMLYDIDLSQSTASPVNPSGNLILTWAHIKSK